MTTYRKTYSLKCGTTVKSFGFKKPTYEEVGIFVEQNSPTTNDITVIEGLKEIPDTTVSYSPKSHHKGVL